MCTFVKTSVEDDNLLREGWGCVNLMVFIKFESFTFWFDRESIIPVILGLLGISIRSFLLVYAD